MSIYAPDRLHNWIKLDGREHRDVSNIIQFENGRIFVAKNYAGQLWGYELEKVQTTDGSDGEQSTVSNVLEEKRD